MKHSIFIISLLVQLTANADTQLSTKRQIASPPTIAQREVIANGLRISYKEKGVGLPLILLHGGGLTSKSWENFIQLASRYFRVIAPDTRDHGQTENVTGAFSYPLLAEDLGSFIAALHLEKPLIFGYSDGGITALTFAKNNPDTAMAIIVSAAAPVSEDKKHYFDGLRIFFGESPEILTESHLDKIAKERPEMIARYRALHGRKDNPEQWRILLKHVWSTWASPIVYKIDELEKIKIPVLILLGDRDEFYKVEDALKLFRILPNAQLAIVPGASHTLFRDMPELFDTLALEFLQKQTAMWRKIDAHKILRGISPNRTNAGKQQSAFPIHREKHTTRTSSLFAPGVIKRQYC